MDLFKEMGKSGKNMSAQETLKELVGHTPLQVLVGATIGIIVALAESPFFPIH